MSFLDPNCTLDMKREPWSQSALDKASEIIKREHYVMVRNLPGDKRIHCFFCEDALREWSEEMLETVHV